MLDIAKDYYAILTFLFSSITLKLQYSIQQFANKFNKIDDTSIVPNN